MPKIDVMQFDGGKMFAFHCDGCGMSHAFYQHDDGHRPSWQFNGDLERPTFTPSLLNRGGDIGVCHLFVTDGKIHYLGDCTHALAGKTVDLPEVD